ncbi:hypothetical protein O4H52_03185 [Sphingomonadaceae bacterium G21617-S1]|nr:hypothetical protein [Sphingomonadaceae bacterium G21617-S1]
MEPGGISTPLNTCFSIPAELVDRESGALALIIHAQGLHGRARGPIRMAQLLLAEWLLTDPAELPGAVETAGIALGEVLAGVIPPSPQAALCLYNLTGGAIRLADWTRFYDRASDQASSPQGDGADRVPAPSPTITRDFVNELGNRIRITIEGPASVSENLLTPVEVAELVAGLTARPIVHGRLGETPPGKLFRVIRGEGAEPYILTGLGCSWALTHADAMGMLGELATALKISVADRIGDRDGAAA